LKILVTGGAGYIGSVLVPTLLENGYEITVIDAMHFGCNLQEHPNLTIHTIDLFDSNEGHFRGHDVVIHLAGLSNDPMANFNPSDNFVQNLSGTSYTAWMARSAGVSKFIFASSCSIYGMSKRGVLTEKDEPESDFPYAVSKHQAEKSLKHLARNDFQICILRQATVYGYAPRMRTDLVVNTMTKNAICDETIYMNDPSLCRPLIHVKDLCDVYVKLLKVKHELPEIINVASKNYTIEEIAVGVHDALRNKILGVKIVNRNLKDPRSYQVDTLLLQKIIGKVDPIDLKDGVLELVNNIAVDDIATWTDPNWVNVEMYKQRLHNARNT
jgi:nucleoside-diphosphate-sugar epimerase